MKPVRSSLFVPGNRAAWMEKAAGYGADLLILDLEDSVPDAEKVGARGLVRQAIELLAAKGQATSVRVNGFATGLTADDIAAVVGPHLTSITLPKVETLEDMRALDAMLSKIESQRGLPAGQIQTPLGLETAKAMRNVYEIASACPRVNSVTLAAGPGGDAARAVGYQWSKEGLETLYLRSKVVLDARAAGIEYPMISSWWTIPDLEGLERDARWNRSLGYRGMSVMHPSHVPIVNRVFTPTKDEIEYAQGLLAAMDEAKTRGVAAVTYKGDMVDIAMAATARELLDFASSIGIDRI